MDASFLIRPEAVTDHQAVRRVVADAFGSQVEADLVDRIRTSNDFVPEMALVALIDDEIVGHVIVSHALIRHRGGERRIVMLSPLAVAPAHQGRGVGSALVREVTAIADVRGEPIVVLEGSPRYYSRFGFERADRLGIDIRLPAWAPADAAQALRLAAYDDGDPSLRGDVVYPPAFDGVE